MTKPTLKEQIAALKGQVIPESAKPEKLEKKARGGAAYVPTGEGPGGARSGSGRKPLEADAKRVSIKRSWEDFAEEDVEVTELHAGTKEQRKAKMKRLRVIQQKLYEAATKGDVSAIREFNDRVGGKARQPIVGDSEEDPVKIDIELDRMLEKVYGTEDDDKNG